MRHLRLSKGFTLIEMITAVALLVIVIMAVGLIFRGTSKAVGLSQASAEVFSNFRATGGQLEADLSRLDRNGFLAIRSRLDPSGRRVDQLVFMAMGNFRHRTGSWAANPFDDPNSADAALVWVGHLAYQGAPDQTVAAPLLDTSFDTPGTTSSVFYLGKSDMDMRLGRRALLLSTPVAGNTSAIGAAFNGASAFTTAKLSAGNVLANTATDGASGPAANITASRVDVVTRTPQQFMTDLLADVAPAGTRGAGGARWEADNYCYRSYAPRNVYDVESGLTVPTVVASIRMNAILLQGCPSFAVEWADGTLYQGADVGTIAGVTANDVGDCGGTD